MLAIVCSLPENIRLHCHTELSSEGWVHHDLLYLADWPSSYCSFWTRQAARTRRTGRDTRGVAGCVLSPRVTWRTRGALTARSEDDRSARDAIMGSVSMGCRTRQRSRPAETG